MAFHTNGRPLPIARAPDIHYGPNVTRTATQSRKESRRSLKEPLLLPVILNLEVPVT